MVLGRRECLSQVDVSFRRVRVYLAARVLVRVNYALLPAAVPVLLLVSHVGEDDQAGLVRLWSAIFCCGFNLASLLVSRVCGGICMLMARGGWTRPVV